MFKKYLIINLIMILLIKWGCSSNGRAEGSSPVVVASSNLVTPSKYLKTPILIYSQIIKPI